MNKGLFILLLIISASASARERSQSELKAIAASKLSATTEVKGFNGIIMPLNESSLQVVADDAAYSIYTSSETQGFAIVAKSDLVENPVIGYSTEAFDAEQMPPALSWYLREASSYLQAIEDGLVTAPHRAATYVPVENFVTTKWSQEYPFDRKTPNNYPSGCVATTLAQCLNYWQYPASAEFDATYYVTITSGKTEKTESKTAHVSSNYTWPYKDTYKTLGRYGDNIDELLRDCGYACNMSYSKDGSGTLTFYAACALTHEFGYPMESIRYHYIDEYPSFDDWTQIIYDELKLKCPVFYSGNDENYGGHAFLFSGIDADGMVYVNWGWRGAADGFYDISLLNPTQGNNETHFTRYHQMITGIRPQPLPTDRLTSYINTYSGEPYTLRWGTEIDGDGVEHNTLFCDMPYGFINMTPVDFEGVFGLFAHDLTDDTDWVIAPQLQDRDTLQSMYGYGGDSDDYKKFYFYYFVDGDNGLIPGHDYRMAFGTCHDHEGIWHSIVGQDGEVAYDIHYTGDPATSTVSPVAVEVPHIVSTAIHPIPVAPAISSFTGFFDLNGRSLRMTDDELRMANLPKGIYILNGKKVVVK